MRVPRTVPAARVLAEAEETNARLGHDVRGSLSADRGFLPAQPLLALPDSHARWDEAAARLPDLFRTLAVRPVLDALPVLPADTAALPDAALLRAATVLGLLGHAYVHVHVSAPALADLPAGIAVPWAEVRRRLGRGPDPVLAYTDLIVDNWRVGADHATALPTFEDLRLLVPTVDNQEERVFYLTQVDILARCAPVVRAVVAAQQAVCDDEPERLAAVLDDITAALRTVTRRSLPRIDPRPHALTHVDPVVWAKTVAPLAVPFTAGVLGPSGTASPVFNLLDALLGRRGHASLLGTEILLHRRSYPVHWRRFLDAVDRVPLDDYVRARSLPGLMAAFAAARDAYAGPEGFLGQHRRKVAGYLTIAFMVGRGLTIGGFAGSPRERTWHTVDAALTASRLERLPVPRRPADAEQGRPRPAGKPRGGIPVADLAEHNDDGHGWWLAVEGRVHDVTGFLRRHPGGPAVLRAHAGLDATTAFGRSHTGGPGLRRLLEATDIGPLAHPDLTAARELYLAWTDALAAAVHLQNAFRLDRSFARDTDLDLPGGAPASAVQVDRAADTLDRFENDYLPAFAAEVLEPLVDRLGPRRSPAGTARAARGVQPRSTWRDRANHLDRRLAEVKGLLVAGARCFHAEGDAAPVAVDLRGLVEEAAVLCAVPGRITPQVPVPLRAARPRSPSPASGSVSGTDTAEEPEAGWGISAHRA
jgi:hypothetical protein